ncbi:MAG: pyrimidine-nucleoside phosphorylase, partial [Thermoanaerobacterium sp.]|nr:pyrimidine-nucleoside phosphorylase [Thermoanaerobacterium sp.]
LPQAKYVESWIADDDLYIKDLYSLDLGLIAMRLGAGRSTKEDTIDLSVGIMLGGKIGDVIKKGQPIATVYANDKNKLDWAMNEIKKYILVSDQYVKRPQLIYM